ncbi:MAG: hypothetical protein AAFO07_26435 [Bacteroidota bacterium]
MKKYIFSIVVLSCLFIQNRANAQEIELDTLLPEEEFIYEELEGEVQEEFSDLESKVISESEFAIPSAPAFSLMGVTPELVPRPGVVRNFKVDWRIRDYMGAPDLAIEALPVWMLFYNSGDLDKYRRSSGFGRMLSTLSFSLSTASFNSTNHLGYAVKLNLFRAKDPLNDQSILDDFHQQILEENADNDRLIEELEALLDRSESPEMRKVYRRQIKQLRQVNQETIRAKRTELESIRQSYTAANWNASMLDIAYGKVYSYDRADIDSLGMVNEGYGLWLNGGIKSGRNGYISGIVKLSRYGEVDAFQVGLSMRYGNPKYNFFLESFYERTTETVDIDPEFDPFKFKQTNYRLSYGGDFRLSRSILLNFSLQTRFEQGFKFRDFLPIANLTCLMR